MGETAPFWRFSATSYPDLETAAPAGALLRNPSRPLNGNSSTSSRICKIMVQFCFSVSG
ncbi:unnamed protein product [Camellia sinensis]